MGLKALRRTIELLLQKLNICQEQMNELNREELLEIMADNNLDLSWIASQESVDALKESIDRIGAALVPDWNQPEVPSNNLDILKYTLIDDSKKIIISKIISHHDDLGVDDLVFTGTYTIDGITYTTHIGGIGTQSFVNPYIKTITIGEGVIIDKGCSFGRTYVDGANVFSTALTKIDMSAAVMPKEVGSMDWCKGASALEQFLCAFTSVPKVTHAAFAFQGCSSLTSLDLTHMDFRPCENMISMFEDCTNLKEIRVGRTLWPTVLPESSSDMFKNCGVDHVTLV